MRDYLNVKIKPISRSSSCLIAATDAFVLDFSHYLIKIQNIVPRRSFRERFCPPPQVKVGGGGEDLTEFGLVLPPLDLRTSLSSFAFVLTAEHHGLVLPSLDRRTSRSSFAFVLTAEHHGPVLPSLDRRTSRPSFAFS
jgi:hypothetical protein